MSKPMLSKPTLASKSAAALSFSEPKKEASEKRAFFAPEGYRRLTVNIREDLHRKLKIAAIEQGCTATDIVERLLRSELA